MKPSDSNGSILQDRLVALAALAVQPRAAPGPCPPPEELAAFSEGRLPPEARAHTLAHLDACPDCYRDWLAVQRVVAEQPAAVVTPLTRQASRRRPAIGWRSGIGMALAASLLIALIGWWPLVSGPTPAEQVAQAYETVLQASSGLPVETIAARRLPWEDGPVGYGFAAGGATEPAIRAFGVGLWTGRAMLRSRDPQTMPMLPPELAPPAGPGTWEATEWAPYTVLGRWLVLLQVLCASPQDVSAALWEQQQAIGRRLQAAFRERPANEAAAAVVIKALAELAAGFDSHHAGSSPQRLCQQVEPVRTGLEARLLPSAP
jgi:hypothetical protein